MLKQLWAAGRRWLRRTRERADPLGTRWSQREALLMLRATGCPVCARLAEDAERTWWWFFIETYHSPDVLVEFVRSGGFCPRHARRAVEEGPRYVISHLYHLVVREVLVTLSALRRWRVGQTICPLCRMEQQSEQIAIFHFAIGLQDPEVEDAYRHHAPLCLKHLGQALHVAPPESAVVLTDAIRPWLEQMDGQFYEYFRKVDYRFAHEPKGEEQLAWYRILTWAAGAPMPVPRDAGSGSFLREQSDPAPSLTAVEAGGSS